MNRTTYAKIVDAVRVAVADEIAIAMPTARPRVEFRVIESACFNPAGHVYLSCCGTTRCLHCEQVA